MGERRVTMVRVSADREGWVQVADVVAALVVASAAVVAVDVDREVQTRPA